MLGQEFAAAFEKADIPYMGTGSETDITDLNTILSFTLNKNFSYIINCSAYTAVDKAETEYEKAMRINCGGVKNVARAAKQAGAVLIHFSTDYVFDGYAADPYKETDMVNPLSVYGKTKLAGERAVISELEKYYIFRVSWLYGKFGTNFVNTMIRIMNEKSSVEIVGDRTGSPTYTESLVENIVKLIDSGSNKYGVYHYSDEGIISWYDFAVAINRFGVEHGVIRKGVELKRISSEQYPTVAKRPIMAALNKDKIREHGFIRINNWEENLKNYFQSYGGM
jgi:dTDP-4-dehydrorhamnose reductase